MPADADSFGAVAGRLLNNGWTPLPACSKQPAIAWKEYQRRQPSHVEVLAWEREFPNANTVLVMGTDAIALDFDEDDGSEAMRLHDIADEVFGPSPVIRVGRYPRTLRLYRPARVGKQRSVGHVEILGRGRVAVAFGIHPVTGLPYRHVGPVSPLDIRPADLPPITRRQVEQFRREVETGGVPSAQPARGGKVGQPLGRTGMRFAEAMCGAVEGRRHRAIFAVASACRGFGVTEDTAVVRVRDAASRCRPPLPAAEAVEVVSWCYRTFPEGSRVAAPALVSTPDGVPPLLWIAHQRAQQSASTRYERLVAMCADLQRLFGEDQPVAVPQPRWGKLLGCSQRNVAKLLRKATDEGRLTLADPDYVPHVRAKKYWVVG